MKKIKQKIQGGAQPDPVREKSFEGLLRDLNAGISYSDLLLERYIVGRELDSGAQIERSGLAALLREKVILGTVLTQSKLAFDNSTVSFRLWKEVPQFQGTHPDATLNRDILLFGMYTTVEQAYCFTDLVERHYAPEKIIHPHHMTPLARVYRLR